MTAPTNVYDQASRFAMNWYGPVCCGPGGCRGLMAISALPAGSRRSMFLFPASPTAAAIPWPS